MYDLEQIEERVILLAVDRGLQGITASESIEELAQLAETAGAVVVANAIQKRDNVHPAYYLGKGKIEEIKILIEGVNATGIICDDELTNVQIKNLENLLDIKVMDRTILILDIFASRAQSMEGKIQVELAQQKYRLTHLSGIGKSLSRLGGGIGTRGPGEKKLETDRRHIRNIISELESELKNIATHRQLLREKRKKQGDTIVSLIGYTNAGKSTLLNCLSSASVLAEDKLFATLDITTRKIELPGGSAVLLSDTVGFIQKIPHQLIKAFRSTLEELKYADVLIHVVDASNKNIKEQMDVVYQTLTTLDISNTPIITVYNKIDKEIEFPLPIDKYAVRSINISAKQKIGTIDLLELIEEQLRSQKTVKSILIPYNKGYLINLIYNNCEIIYENHIEDGIEIKAYMNAEIENKLNRGVNHPTLKSLG